MATDNPNPLFPEDPSGIPPVPPSPQASESSAGQTPEPAPLPPPPPDPARVLPADSVEEWMTATTESFDDISALMEEIRRKQGDEPAPDSLAVPDLLWQSGSDPVDGPVTESLEDIRAAVASTSDLRDVPVEPMDEFFVPSVESLEDAAFPDEPESALNIPLDPSEMAPVTEVIAVHPQSDLLYEPEPPLPIDPESLELLASALTTETSEVKPMEELHQELAVPSSLAIPAHPIEDSPSDDNIVVPPWDANRDGSSWLDASAEPPAMPVAGETASATGEPVIADADRSPSIPVPSEPETGLIFPEEPATADSSSIFADAKMIGSSLFDDPSIDTALSAFMMPTNPAKADEPGARSVNPPPKQEGTVAEMNLETPSQNLLEGIAPGLPGLPTSVNNFAADDSDDATMVDEPIPFPIGFDGGVDFDQTDTSSSGSNLFAEAQPDDLYGASGLNLPHHDADYDPALAGAQSSIFVNDAEDLTEADFPGMDDPPSELDMNFSAPAQPNLFGSSNRSPGEEDPNAELGFDGFDGFDPNLDADSAPSSIFNADIPGGLAALGRYGDDDALDPPSELDMGAIPAPPSSIFRPAKGKPPEQAWGDDDDGSIFGQELDELTEAEFVGMDDDPSELDMDTLPAPKSSIFRLSGSGTPPAHDPQNQGRVSFDIPSDANRGSSHATETSGFIDWAVPPDADELNRINLASTGATGPLHQARDEAGLDQWPVAPPSQPIPRPTTPAVEELESWAEPEGGDDPAPPVDTERTGESLQGVTETAPARSKKTKPAAPARKPSRMGGLTGIATGLLAGVGVCAGAYFGGLIPGTSQPIAAIPPVRNVAPIGPTSVAEDTITAEEAYKLLAAGDPIRALKGFEQAPEDAAADVRVARGQARWLTRIRELSANNQPANATDAELQKATADLEAGQADPRTAVQAILHLGLLKEVTGDIPAARAIYSQAANQYPDAKPIFEAALRRLQAVTPAQPGTQQSRLSPRQADELAQAVVLTLVLLQDAAPQPTQVREPGILFWQAINDAAAGNYDAAIRAINDARKLHDKLRLQHAGVGINPLSDPLHQIFLRACDDLRDYWVLRRDVYGHPQVGELARKDGVTKTLNTLMESVSTAAKLESEKKQLLADLDLTGKKLKDAETLLVKVGTEKDTALKDLTDVQKLLAERTTELTNAEAKLKTANATFAAIIAELKTNQLIDSDDPARLPAVLKTVAAAAASSDAKKAAAILLEARKTLAMAQEDVKKAEAEVKTAQAQAQSALDNVNKRITAVKAEKDKTIADLNEKAAKDAASYQAQLQKATEARLAEIKAREDALAAAEAQAARELAAREAEFRKKLAEQADDFTQKITGLRSGAPVPLSTGERAAQERAARAFSSGVIAYQDGRYPAAVDLFTKATEDDAHDARYWYYLGLTHYAQGNTAEAKAAFQKGAELEARNRPASSVIAASLERVQGGARRVLSAHRP
ncbi:MAG: tetratricopeptide repeat protein [Bacteroidales bacterium]|nr:tetratricopeptide repeat protein [Bacteroidales bacterium]